MGSMFCCRAELIYEMTEDQFVQNGGGVAFFDAGANKITTMTKIHRHCGGLMFERGNLDIPECISRYHQSYTFSSPG